MQAFAPQLVASRLQPLHPVPGTGRAYPLPAIPYLRLRCTLRSQGEALLPEYKGSLLRGAFGHALRAATCAQGPRQECPTCRLRHACLYPRLFESLIEGEAPPFLHGLPTAPRPYVFEPATAQRRFAPGDPLDFDLLLLGQATALAPYALLAIERMAERGLGSERSPFALDRVESPRPGGGWSAIAPTPLVPSTEPLGEDRTVLRFLTPTRFRSQGRLLPALSFRALVFAMLRRTLEIAHFHVPGVAIDWDFHDLLVRASGVRLVASRLRWHDWERYSNRQRTAMKLGGFVGEMEIEGDLEPFAPLLRTAEILHVGKNATFGLGRLEVGAREIE